MTNLAIDYAHLTRICEFARRLHQLHRLGDDEAIDSEFSAVCRSIWFSRFAAYRRAMKSVLPIRTSDLESRTSVPRAPR
jgi:hypothetical protein